MKINSTFLRGCRNHLGASLMLASLLATSAQAETLESKVQRLERLVLEQQRRLTEQEEDIARQRYDLEVLRGRALGPAGLAEERGRSRNADLLSASGRSVAGTDDGPDEIVLTQAETEIEPVGEPPPEREPARPEVQAIPELGGVLTPERTLVVEPKLTFSNSQTNRFTFQGVEIIPTFLIGIFEVEDADRDLISPALNLRYGLTDRIELEAEIPYVFREDMLAATIPQAAPAAPVTLERALDGDGIGDIEATVHYQINRGPRGWPVFVANLRYKSDTGEGPFDVDFNADGQQTELPTGSGFSAFEPSVTALFPTDPAVLFANVGYLFNLEEDVDKVIGNATVGKVDPGDAFRVRFGMGIAVNPRTSLTLGYSHDFIQETDTEINNAVFSSSTLDVGSLLLGFSYRVTPKFSVNLNLQLGITADAPDVQLTLRLPYTFSL